jgi:hypothetical protein
MENLTINQIRDAIDHMERNYQLAMEAGDTGLASAFNDKLEALGCELESRIQTEGECK